SSSDQSKSSLSISEIEVQPVRANRGLIAFASCVINNQFFLGSIAIHTKLDGSGLRLVFPAKTLANGKSIPIFYPITKEVGGLFLESITEHLDHIGFFRPPDQNQGSTSGHAL